MEFDVCGAVGYIHEWWRAPLSFYALKDAAEGLDV